jgi:hypothetical protein
MQDHLFKAEGPTVYTKATIGLDSSVELLGRMVVYQEKLYIGSYSLTVDTDDTAACLIVYDKSDDSWTVITKADIGFVAADDTVEPIAVYDGKLWVGTNNYTAASDGTGASIACFDGTTWTRYTKGDILGTDADCALGVSWMYGCGLVFDDKLFISTYNPTAATDSTAAKLLVYDGTSWSRIVKSTIGASNADKCFISGAVYDGYAFWGTYNSTAATDSTAAKLVRYSGSAWTTYNKSTFGGVNADRGIGIYNDGSAVYNLSLIHI